MRTSVEDELALSLQLPWGARSGIAEDTNAKQGDATRF